MGKELPANVLDYNPIIDYHNQIESGMEVVGRKVRQAYKKIVRDIFDESSEWEYSPGHANHVIDFIERYCRHSKGRWAGQPIRLELWQKAFISAGYGFVHKISGERKYQELGLFVGRKNGKSTISSGLSLYHLVADGEGGPEVYCVSTKRDAAKIVWNESKRMVKKSPSLSKRIKSRVNYLASDFNDGVYLALSSDSHSLDGLNSSMVSADELHAWKDSNLYDVMRDSMSARENPMFLIISTMGTVRAGIFDILYDLYSDIIDGWENPDGYKNERVLPIIYELDKPKDIHKEKNWKMANPALGTIKSVDQLRDKYGKAMKNPMLLPNLLCKDFNVRSSSQMGWLQYDQYNNKATFDMKALRPRYGIAGADFSKGGHDLTAVSVLFMLPDEPTIYVTTMYWIPRGKLEQSEQQDRVPYQRWYELGLLRVCEGQTVDQSDIVAWLMEVQDETGIMLWNCGYDSWSASAFVQQMEAIFGKSAITPVIQGKKTLSAPMYSLESKFKMNWINYNDNPITKWCIGNTEVEMDKNGNIQPVKMDGSRLKRIDGLASMLNAYVVLQDRWEEYQTLI